MWWQIATLSNVLALSLLCGGHKTYLWCSRSVWMIANQLLCGHHWPTNNKVKRIHSCYKVALKQLYGYQKARPKQLHEHSMIWYLCLPAIWSLPCNASWLCICWLVIISKAECARSIRKFSWDLSADMWFWCWVVISFHFLSLCMSSHVSVFVQCWSWPWCSCKI